MMYIILFEILIIIVSFCSVFAPLFFLQYGYISVPVLIIIMVINMLMFYVSIWVFSFTTNRIKNRLKNESDEYYKFSSIVAKIFLKTDSDLLIEIEKNNNDWICEIGDNEYVFRSLAFIYCPEQYIASFITRSIRYETCYDKSILLFNSSFVRLNEKKNSLTLLFKYKNIIKKRKLVINGVSGLSLLEKMFSHIITISFGKKRSTLVLDSKNEKEFIDGHIR